MYKFLTWDVVLTDDYDEELEKMGCQKMVKKAEPGFKAEKSQT